MSVEEMFQFTLFQESYQAFSKANSQHFREKGINLLTIGEECWNDSRIKIDSNILKKYTKMMEFCAAHIPNRPSELDVRNVTDHIFTLFAECMMNSNKHVMIGKNYHVSDSNFGGYVDSLVACMNENKKITSFLLVCEDKTQIINDSIATPNGFYQVIAGASAALSQNLQKFKICSETAFCAFMLKDQCKCRL